MSSLYFYSSGNVVVYIWMPRSGNYGHASLQLPNGTYISWWPAGKGKDEWAELNWAACTAVTSGRCGP